MLLSGKHIVVTGAGSGIGRALVTRFAQERPRGVVVVDIDGDAARVVARAVDGLAIAADLTREEEVLRVIDEAQARFGPVDVYHSNAGRGLPYGGAEAPDGAWNLLWNLHVMSHVWAARALVPDMIERGEGYLINTASAAGLAMVPGAAPYTVTKHAAVALAESLAVLHQGTGVHFSCLCPGLVDTPLVREPVGHPVTRAIHHGAIALDAASVAAAVVKAIDEERFLILTHPEVRGVAQYRATSPDDYLTAMSALWADVTKAG
jgi:NAD(P)-dependent dehydrogenase (short-subunit alcohol dehydrogenase family)